MPYVDQCSFRVDEFMPSLNQIKETFFGDDRYTYEGSFDDCYKRNFSDFGLEDIFVSILGNML